MGAARATCGKRVRPRTGGGFPQGGILGFGPVVGLQRHSPATTISRVAWRGRSVPAGIRKKFQAVCPGTAAAASRGAGFRYRVRLQRSRFHSHGAARTQTASVS
jgi:hypothetical protein